MRPQIARSSSLSASALRDTHAACKLLRSYGAPPSSSSTRWSTAVARPLHFGNRI
jgi:hypothetical protein